MNSADTKSALSSVRELEDNSKRLSEITSDLNILNDELKSLKNEVGKAEEAIQTGYTEITKLNTLVDSVQEKLTTEIRLRLAEGLVEQTSRVKDANEKLNKLEIQNDDFRRKLENNSKTAKFILLIQIVILAAIVVLSATNFGLISFSL